MPEWEAPLGGYVTIRIGGDRVTRVSVDEGEEIAVEMEAGD